MPRSRNIGGSLLPSSAPQILQPMPAPFGTLQVRAMPEMDTHFLTLTWGENGEHSTCLAEHSNGYTCHELAKRMLAGDVERVTAQLRYILDCGGMARHEQHVIGLLTLDRQAA